MGIHFRIYMGCTEMGLSGLALKKTRENMDSLQTQETTDVAKGGILDMEEKNRTPIDGAFGRLATSIEKLRNRMDSLIGSVDAVTGSQEDGTPTADEPPPPSDRAGSSPIVERLDDAADELDRLRFAIEACQHGLEI